MSDIDRIEDNAVAAIRDAINNGDDFRVWVRAALLEYGAIKEKEVREECANVAMDMPLISNEERHAYRWTDTSKAVAWDIAVAIRRMNDAHQG